jgi:hypothetical protein
MQELRVFVCGLHTKYDEYVLGLGIRLRDFSMIFLTDLNMQTAIYNLRWNVTKSDEMPKSSQFLMDTHVTYIRFLFQVIRASKRRWISPST